MLVMMQTIIETPETVSVSMIYCRIVLDCISFSYKCTKLYLKLSFHHRNPQFTLPFLSAFSHSAPFASCELPKSYLESIFTHPLNPQCPSTSAALSLVDLLWQVFTDLIMTADAQTFPSPAAIGVYLFSLFSLWNVPMLNSPLLTDWCHSGMNCRELSPEIGKTANRGTADV